MYYIPILKIITAFFLIVSKRVFSRGRQEIRPKISRPDLHSLLELESRVQKDAVNIPPDHKSG